MERMMCHKGIGWLWHQKELLHFEPGYCIAAIKWKFHVKIRHIIPEQILINESPNVRLVSSIYLSRFFISSKW